MVYGKDLTAGAGDFFCGAAAVDFAVFMTVAVLGELSGDAALTGMAAFLPPGAAAGFGVFTVDAALCDLTDGAGLVCSAGVCPVGFTAARFGGLVVLVIFAFSSGATAPPFEPAFSEAFGIDWVTAVRAPAE